MFKYFKNFFFLVIKNSLRLISSCRKKSLKLNPNNYNTLYNKSLTHFELKEFKKACIDLKNQSGLVRRVLNMNIQKSVNKFLIIYISN